MSKKEYDKCIAAINSIMEDIVECSKSEHKEHVKSLLKQLPIHLDKLYDLDASIKMKEIRWALDKVQMLRDAIKLVNTKDEAYRLIEIISESRKKGWLPRLSKGRVNGL